MEMMSTRNTRMFDTTVRNDDGHGMSYTVLHDAMIWDSHSNMYQTIRAIVSHSDHEATDGND